MQNRRSESFGESEQSEAAKRTRVGNMATAKPDISAVSDKEKSNASLQSDKNFSFGKNPNKEKDTETMQNRTYIDVPYDDKDRAKSLGAGWDKPAKSWYIRKGRNPDDFKEWPVHDPLNIPKVAPQVAFADLMREAGFALEGSPKMDGQWHPVPLQGQKGSKASGSYIAHLDGVPRGTIHNHKTGEKISFVHTGQEITPEDRKAIVEQRKENAAANEQARQEGYDKAARKAQYSIRKMKDATLGHPYLAKKGVLPSFIKETSSGNLAIPLQNIKGEIRSMQYIAPDGTKKSMGGGQKSGHFHLLGSERDALSRKTQTIIIAEGYATAATIHEATGKPVVAAMDSGNLKAVAEAIRGQNPEAKIIFAADNDHDTLIDGQPYNTGIEKAKLAAKAVGGQIIYPHLQPNEKEAGLNDFNDVAQSRGMNTAKVVIRSALEAANKTQQQGMGM